MKLQIVKGSTSQIVTVFIQDSSSTTGAGLGSLDQNSSIVGGYVRAGATGVALTVDENVTTEGTYEAPSAAGKVRIGTPANMTTGTYELHLHNDLLAAGADSVFITLGGASNMAVLVIEIQLTTVDLNTALNDLNQANIRSAVGLASASLDTQLADIPTVAEMNARTLLAASYGTAANQTTIAGYIDTEIGAIVTHLTDIKGGGFNGATDSIEAIRNRGDAAWVTAVSVTVSDKTGFTLTTADHNAIADALLRRNASNVEDTAGEHTLCTIILSTLESSISGTTWTIKRTDGSTTHATKTVTVDADADPITGVA